MRMTVRDWVKVGKGDDHVLGVAHICSFVFLSSSISTQDSAGRKGFMCVWGRGGGKGTKRERSDPRTRKSLPCLFDVEAKSLLTQQERTDLGTRKSLPCLFNVDAKSLSRMVTFLPRIVATLSPICISHVCSMHLAAEVSSTTTASLPACIRSPALRPSPPTRRIRAARAASSEARFR